MTIRAPNSPGLDALHLRSQDGLTDASANDRSVGLSGFVGERLRGTPSSAEFDGEKILAMDVWDGAQARSFGAEAVAAPASGGIDAAGGIEHDVDHVLAALQ
ncbi:MAG TPA: hypothetical protein VGC30_01770 [Dokdonella sp.]